MFVYWGDTDSGKGHIKDYARLNDKTYLLWFKLQLKKVYTQGHIDGGEWRDETVRRVIYHSLDGELRKCEKTESKIWKADRVVEKKTKNAVRLYDRKPKKKKRKGYSQEDLKKYTQKEYIHTNVYFDMILQDNHSMDSGKNVNGLCQEITSDMIKDYYDEILKDVDLINYILPEWAVNDMLPYLRKSVNIVPYKSDHLDKCISHLDGFSRLRPSENGNKLLDVYAENKNRVWRYLDTFYEDIERMKRRLERNEIPYIMFDLDTDSSPDTFGWKVDVDRKYTHRGHNWDEEIASSLESIAKEYLSLRSLK